MKKKLLVFFIVVTMGLMVMSSCSSNPPEKGTEPPTAELQAKIDELYASGPGELGRIQKMQAFIMEIALHAKTRNPNFKIIVQDGINLAFEDGEFENGELKELISLVDGWGIEGLLAPRSRPNFTFPVAPNEDQQKYMYLTQLGLMVTETSNIGDISTLEHYYAGADAWNIIPYPKVGGALARDIMFKGKRWSQNSNYFWIEDPEIIGIGDRMHNGAVNNLTQARNYLYHINGRPYDAWETWDDEEAEERDRTRITAAYACGLLVPYPGGSYQPYPPTDATVSAAIAEYGTEWDWWWRAAGYNETQGREIWLRDLRASNYDVIYIDSFYNHRARPENQTPLTRAEVDSLKYKPNGARRQIIAYLNVGAAEQNRWYIQDAWVEEGGPDVESEWVVKNGYIDDDGVYHAPPAGVPAWLALSYGGGYDEEAIVQWWHPEWRDIIVRGNSIYRHKTTGDNTASIDRIISQGFDGVYLDNVAVIDDVDEWDAFEEYWLAHGGIPGEK